MKTALKSVFAKLQKLGTSWHALCCWVRLVLACLSSYSDFIATALAACGTTKAGRSLVQTANARLRKLSYEAKNFRVTVLSQKLSSSAWRL